MKRDWMDKYSKTQWEAIRIFDKDICVSAGAGSGKTSVLVERFLYAVTEKKIDPGRILAITFTEKAANEMKSRLVEACRRRGLHEFRRKLESAYIGTIHSFCARILRENPIESGVDPYFQILGDGEAQILANRVMDRFFEEQSQNESWLAVLCEYGEEAVRKALHHYYQMSRVTADEAGIFKITDMTLRKKNTGSEVIKKLRGLVGDLDRPDATEAECKLRDRAKAILETALSIGERDDLKILSVQLACGQELHKKIHRHRETVTTIRQLVDIWASLALEGLGAPVKKELKRMAGLFKDAYDSEKKARGVYDFDDLLYLAFRLLSGKSIFQAEVRRRYQDNFYCLLVDEYQDTSPLQDRIIELLRGKGNWFIVGDTQQSIYGFRQAEPEVFALRIKENQKNGNNIMLYENYRSKEKILDFINGLFEKLSTKSVFQPLKAQRVFRSQKKYDAEILFIVKGKEEGGDQDEARVVEARTLASRIKEWVDTGLEIQISDGSTRRIRYKDIAVLFRSMARSFYYEKELADLAIPFYVTKGGGFYEKPEVMDLVNFLKIIENPHRDIALAGVLRSPLVCLSDDALFWFAWCAKQKDTDRPLADALENYYEIRELGALDRERLARFLGLLRDIRNNKETVALSEMLQRILNASDYEAKVLTRPGGRQKVANVRKLVQMAQIFEGKQLFGIEDFVRFLEALSEREVSESEARLEDQDADAVRLSTIHAAKGLEFPCVVLADMGREPLKTRNDIFLSHPGPGLGLRSRNPLTGKLARDFTFSLIEGLLKEREAEEEKRLLYVALTRAEQHLLLSGSVETETESGQVKPNSSWMSQVAAAVGWSAASQSLEEIRFQEIPLKILTPLKTPAKRGIAPSRFIANDPAARRALSEFSGLTPTEAASLGLPLNLKAYADFKRRFERTEKDYEETEDHTVTEVLLAAGQDKTPFVTIPKEAAAELSFDGEDDATPRNEYGTIFHGVMEHLVRKRNKKITAADIPRGMISALNALEQKEIRQSALRFWSSPWGAVARGAKRCYPELPFIYKTKHGLLKGQIDLVLQTEQDQWLILDYKTNRIAPEDKKKSGETYELQLWLYAAVFAKLFGQVPVKGILYFSVLNEAEEFPYREADFRDADKRLDDHFLSAVSFTNPVESNA